MTWPEGGDKVVQEGHRNQYSLRNGDGILKVIMM